MTICTKCYQISTHYHLRCLHGLITDILLRVVHFVYSQVPGLATTLGKCTCIALLYIRKLPGMYMYFVRDKRIKTEKSNITEQYLFFLLVQAYYTGNTT